MFYVTIFYQIYLLDIFSQFIAHLSIQESIFCVVTFLILMKSNLLIYFYYNLHHNKSFKFCSSIFFFQRKILFRITGQHFLTCIMLIHKTQFIPLVCRKLGSQGRMSGVKMFIHSFTHSSDIIYLEPAMFQTQNIQQHAPTLL